MKKGRKAEVSGIQQTIITLRDIEKLSWGKIDARLQLSKGSSATYYRRGKRALAAREAAQREWERNESHRFSESAWWRLSQSLRERYAERAPFPPEMMTGLRKPKRSRDGRSWGRADNPLLTAEEKTDTQTPSESLSPATSVPAAPQRVAEPIQSASAAPVPPKPVASGPEPQKRIFVFDWRPVDRSGIFDADGDRVSDPSKYIVCEIQRIDTGYAVFRDGEAAVFTYRNQPVTVRADSATRRVMPTIAPAWRVLASNEVFNWNEAKSGERPIFRFSGGKIAAWVEGHGQWSNQIFLAPDDSFVITNCKADDRLVPYTVFRGGEFWASKDGEHFVLELERPCKATGLDYETPTEYQVREFQERYSLNPKHPRQSWLPVLRIAPRPPADTLSLPVPAKPPKPMPRTNPYLPGIIADINEINEQRRAERDKPKPPDPNEDDYFRGIGF